MIITRAHSSPLAVIYRYICRGYLGPFGKAPYLSCWATVSASPVIPSYYLVTWRLGSARPDRAGRSDSFTFRSGSPRDRSGVHTLVRSSRRPIRGYLDGRAQARRLGPALT